MMFEPFNLELPTDRNTYWGPFPDFQTPKIVGYVGLENLHFARNICNTKSVKYDLNLQIDKVTIKEQLDVKLTELLKYLLQNELRLRIPHANKLEDANFICYRGLMKCVACTPYENKEPWLIVAILYKGQIFLCVRHTEEKKQRDMNMTEKEKLFTRWGHKFEQFVLSNSPNSEPDPNIPLDENEEFSLYFTTKLNKHRIFYGAEMDGILCEKDEAIQEPDREARVDAVIDYLSTKKYIELKTSRHIEFPRQEKNFRMFKTNKWWCQSFLAGVETVLCGFRNDDGIVEELKKYHVQDLVQMSRSFWNPKICLNFLDEFFTFVKKVLKMKILKAHGEGALNKLQTLPMIAFMMEWNPRQPVRIADNYNYDDDPILPEWFLHNYARK